MLVKVSKFNLAKQAVHEAVADVVAEIALAVEQRAKYNITEVHAVDTGALRASVYAQIGDDTSAREAAIADATEQAATDGQHSGKPHPFEAAEDGQQISGDLRAKVGVAAEYGIYIEYGTIHADSRPYLSPAVADVAPLGDELLAASVKKALGGIG